MIIKFNEETYRLLKTVQFESLKNGIVFKDESFSVELMDENVVVSDANGDMYEESAIDALLEDIDLEITLTGLSDDQNTVTPRGMALYSLYDEILEYTK